MKAEERRMDSRKLLLLVGALLVAGMTAVFARTLTAGSGAPQAGAAVIVAPPPETGPGVLVATRALPAPIISKVRPIWRSCKARWSAMRSPPASR